MRCVSVYRYLSHDYSLGVEVLFCMPRKKLYRTSDLPYHITARCSNQEWFDLPMPEVWRIFSMYLFFISRAYSVQIHSFVLMSNHFHMLATTPEANIDEAMNYLLREVSKRIAEKSERTNQIFGGPYYWSIIKNNIYYQHAYKYVYRNPVHAGLCRRVEEYPYSTLPGLLGMRYLDIPVIDNQNLIQNTGSVLSWLNQEYQEEDRLSIKSALKHREFCFPQDKSSKSPFHHLENRIV